MADKFVSKSNYNKTFQINVDPDGNFVILNSTGTQELLTGNANNPASKIIIVDGAGDFLTGLNVNKLKTDSLEVAKTISPNVSQTTPPPPRRTQENPTGADPNADVGTNPANDNPNQNPDLSSFDGVLEGLQKGQDKDSYNHWSYPENVVKQDRLYTNVKVCDTRYF